MDTRVIVYESSEDSFLLQKYVKKYAEGNVLEIGTGSGILAEEAALSERVKKVLAVDIQKSVIEHCKKEYCKKEHCNKTTKSKKIEFLQSDLFSRISQTKKFDTIIFNPPYLPADPKYPDIALDAGKKGYEIILRFLADVNEYLHENGKILLLFSSLSRKNVIDDALQKHLLTAILLEQQHISFETLYIYLIQKTILLQEIEKHNINHVRYFTKGKRGLIYRGKYKNKEVVVKAENPKATTPSTIAFEVQWLKIMNKINIGPKLLFSTNLFLVMEYIKGNTFEEYIKTAGKNKIKRMIKNMFDQLYCLDIKGINKFEMNHPQKHIIVRKHIPVLLDFERCRFTENPKNVTQFVQFITSRNISHLLQNKKINIQKEKIIGKARKYKKERTKQAYTSLLLYLRDKSSIV